MYFHKYDKHFGDQTLSSVSGTVNPLKYMYKAHLFTNTIEMACLVNVVNSSFLFSCLHTCTCA